MNNIEVIEYQNDFNKVKCINYTLSADKILFIPAYWWYTIKFNDNNTSISCFRYKTYMNNISIIPYIFMHLLQLQNVKRNVVKKIDINQLNEKNATPQSLDEKIG